MLLKNNKIPGVDEIVIVIKYAPSIIHEQIVEMYNEMASSGDHQTEIIKGLLCPIQKSGKTIGPPKNVQLYYYLFFARFSMFVSWKESENVLTTKYHQSKQHIEKVAALQNIFLVPSWILKELSHLRMKLPI